MCVFLDKNDEVLEKYNQIWNKVGKVIKQGFDSEHIYNDNYAKTKMKSYEEKINTNFQDNKLLREGLLIHLPIIIFNDSVFRTCKNYYAKVFQEECKYVIKEKIMPKYIIEDMQISFDDLIKKILRRKFLRKNIL